MKRLGTVLHMTRNGYIVARLEKEEAEKLPPLNVPVYDRDLKKIGTLLDIIGPVKNPYAVVKPANREIKVYEGETLYYKIPRPPRRRQRKAKRPTRERKPGRGKTPRETKAQGQPRPRRGRARRERRGRGAKR